MTKVIYIFLLCQCALAAFSQEVHTALFHRGDMANIWEVMRPVQPGKPESVPVWEEVSLPHCYNAYDAVDPTTPYYQGPAWYKFTVEIPSSPPGGIRGGLEGNLYLHFQGSGQRTQVYVYTELVAEHIGGYDEWYCDITDAVQRYLADTNHPTLGGTEGGLIPIAIRCDNSRDVELIPSDMSDFNLYGGLYRPVTLLKEKPLDFQIDTHLTDNLKEGTITIAQTPPQPSPQGRELNPTPNTQTNTQHPTPITQTITYHPTPNTQPNTQHPTPNTQTITYHPTPNTQTITLYAPNGKVAAKGTLAADGTCTLKVKNPQLWSPDTPNLYKLVIDNLPSSPLGGTEGGLVSIGFRTFRFEPDGPFYLNGKRLLLRGTHRHEDHAGVGAAMTHEQIRQEMLQIKAMGANFIRLGHYQQSRYALDLCDSLGLLVWEEIPWCRGGLGGEAYQKQAHDMLRNMISQHRHHPSIILWGLGNENDWPGDFPTFSKDSIRAFMSSLNDAAHRLDPSRLTTIRRCDFCKDIVDVYSPSIWAGWYSRRFTDYHDMERAGHDLVPRFFHAEWGGDSHAGRHSELTTEQHMLTEAGDRNGDWSESYICRLFDWHLKEQAHMPWLTGAAFWTFKDFSTPLRPDNPIPYVNQKGVVQRDGTPKEAYYVVQSYWTTKPMLHIYGHDWPIRWGKPGEPKEVLVYSNCPEVELFVNGISQGKRRRNIDDFPAAGFHWNVTLQEGENIITAKSAALTDTIRTTYQTKQWGAPADIEIFPVLKERGQGKILVQITDANGIPCLDCKEFIEFGCSVPNLEYGRLGTATGSRRIQAANGRATLTLSLDAGQSGAVTVTVPSLGLSKTILIGK